MSALRKSFKRLRNLLGISFASARHGQLKEIFCWMVVIVYFAAMADPIFQVLRFWYMHDGLVKSYLIVLFLTALFLWIFKYREILTPV